MSINVYFIRHGETYFNCFARLQGWSDTPLTEKGKAEAKHIGNVLSSLKIDYLFSSDLKRAIDTAKILIAQNHNTNIKEPVQNELFREVFYGSFEGHSNEEGAIWGSHLAGKRFRRIGELVSEFGVEKSHDLLREADPAHLAEGSEQLNHRVQKALNFLTSLPDNKNVVVASHGSIIQYIASYVDGHKTYGNLDNGAMMELTISNGQTEVKEYNKTIL